MTDQDIINTYINTNSIANGLRLKQHYQNIKNGDISLVSKEHIDYLLQRFPEFFSISKEEKVFEAIYRIAKHIDQLSRCSICGKPIHYQKGHFRKTCGRLCGLKSMSQINTGRKLSEEAKKKIAETNLKKYGSISPFGNKAVQEKSKQTNLERYGVENAIQNSDTLKKRAQTNIERYSGPSPTNSKEVRQKQIETNIAKYGYSNAALNPEIIQKIKQTNLEKYGSENPFGSEIIKERIKQTNLERYGTENYQQCDEGKRRIHENFATGIPQQKGYETKKKNHTFNTSKGEERLYQILCELYGTDDIIREYSDVARYPFNCDFYIKSLDVFIELQGHYTHGEHPYNPDNIEDQKRVEKYKNYPYIIDVWTIRDPKKRETAKQNNLKYIEIFDSDFTEETIIKEISKVI